MMSSLCGRSWAALGAAVSGLGPLSQSGRFWAGLVVSVKGLEPRFDPQGAVLDLSWGLWAVSGRPCADHGDASWIELRACMKILR